MRGVKCIEEKQAKCFRRDRLKITVRSLSSSVPSTTTHVNRLDESGPASAVVDNRQRFCPGRYLTGTEDAGSDDRKEVPLRGDGVGD